MGADINAHALVIKLSDLRGQLFIGFSPRGQWFTQLGVIAAAVYLENTAHAGESKLALMCLHERVLHPDCLAKYDAAFFRMSRSSVVRLSSELSLTISACSALMSLV